MDKKNVDLVSGAVKPLREFHARLEQSLKVAEKAKAGKIVAIEKDLERVNADCTEATKRLDEANRILQAAQAEVEEVVSGRLITRFIEERAGSADYRKHLGIVAMIREDFSKLSRMIQDYNQLKMAPEPGAVVAIQAAVQDLGINRIVLYIDDLDRCAPDRVLEVLQSIHLLLAFHLFVVVVGVDARWVSYSLADQFKGMLAERKPHWVKGASGLPTDTATPRDYLEKIFQVPFWIKSMEKEGCKRLIAELVRHDLQSAETDAKTSAVAGQRLESASTQPPIREASPTFETAPEPRPESLRLNDVEVTAMGDLARLIGRSPRATKRFVNVYRLIN